MKNWEITAMDGTKSTIEADDVQLTPAGAIFLIITDRKDDNGKQIAEVCGLVGSSFKFIKLVPMPLVDVSKVIHINTGSVDGSI